MRLILGTIFLLLVTLSGLTLPSISWSKEKEPQLCEWMIAPAPEYNGFMRAVGAAGKFLSDNSKVAREAFDFGRAAAAPLKLLFPVATSNDKSMVILGSPLSNREMARTILSEIEKFDDYYAGWGLVKPEKSAIVVSGWTGLPRFVPESPVAWRSIFPLLSAGGARATMFVRRNVIRPKQAVSKTVYFHERAHHLLHWTMGDEEFISEQTQVQEAFADFLPAYFMNVDPRILAADSQADRWESDDPNPRRRTHTAILPSILWRISRMMPETRARTFFPHLMKELNRNSHAARCFEHWSRGSSMSAARYQGARNCAAALFMAITQNLAPDLNLSPLIADVESELKMPGITERIREKISAPEPFSPFTPIEEPMGPLITQVGLSGIVTYGPYLVSFELYKLLSAMLGGE